MCEASRPTFCIHISSAQRGARKKSSFSASYCIFIFIFRRCPYSPYDLVQNFARDLLISRGLRNLRAKILYEPREKILLRAKSPPESSFFARALYDFTRDCLSFARPGKDLRATLFDFARPGICLRATLYTFARPGILLRAVCQEFRAKSCDSKFFFLALILRLFEFLLLTAHGSIFL